MEGTQVMVFQNGNTVTIGSDGDLHRSRSQVSQYRLVVRMHSVLACAQIYGANQKALHDGLHLIQGEPIRARWIAVAEGALEVALVGEPEPKRNRGIRRPRAGWDVRNLDRDVGHAQSSATLFAPPWKPSLSALAVIACDPQAPSFPDPVTGNNQHQKNKCNQAI